jgi:hypothetical protein
MDQQINSLPHTVPNFAAQPEPSTVGRLLTDLGIMFNLDDVYFDTALKKSLTSLPGAALSKQLGICRESIEGVDGLYWKLEQACRKLCLMWQAADWALEAEQDFYSATFHESPALFGHEAVTVYYHLEAFVLFARSALDLSANVFGALLTAPFPCRRYDSFNKLVKAVKNGQETPLRSYFEQLREDSASWVSVVSGSERGRSLRDRISHQTEFPLDYVELRPPSEKEYAVVWVDRDTNVPLPDFISSVRDGVIDGFTRLENECVLSARASAQQAHQADDVRKTDVLVYGMSMTNCF